VLGPRVGRVHSPVRQVEYLKIFIFAEIFARLFEKQNFLDDFENDVCFAEHFQDAIVLFIGTFARVETELSEHNE
jgi:hypothetical protein